MLWLTLLLVILAGAGATLWLRSRSGRRGGEVGPRRHRGRKRRKRNSSTRYERERPAIRMPRGDGRPRKLKPTSRRRSTATRRAG